MSATLDDLPQELWNRIVSLLRYDYGTLLNLSLTSTRFLDEARSQLYRVISVEDQERPPLPRISFSQCPRFLSTLIHNPSLAKHIKKFLYEDYKIGKYHKDLHRALRLMVNLTWLELNTKHPGIPRGFFKGCTFQLTFFRCVFDYIDNTELYKFLSSQYAIQTLFIVGLAEHFPSEACPDLRRLIFHDWPNASYVLPGRYISRMEFLQLDPSFDGVPTSIMSDLGYLKQLVYQCAADRGNPYGFFKNVGPYLTRLAVLRIITRDDSDSGNETNTITNEPSILYTLTNLHTLIWSPQLVGSIWSSRRVQLSPQVKPSVELWFKNMPKLQVVYCQDFNGGYDGLTKYFGWRRDGSEEVVDAEVVLRGRWFYKNH